MMTSSKTAGSIEIWLDDLMNGKMITTIPVSTTGGENNRKMFSKAIKDVSGRYDVFVKSSKGNDHAIYIQSIRFVRVE